MRYKFPSFSQWKQILKVLKKSEKILLLTLFFLAASSFITLNVAFYVNNTRRAPTLGGTYIEGVVGQPRFINPIYGETNDVDRTLIGLVFSGLMTYDKEGNMVTDLAKDYTVSDDGKIYEFHLKDNISWHDGIPLGADDILFTIKTIQGSDYKSPQRANWIDVGVEKISDRSVRFLLKSPYNSFLENCTLKILPKHIWENITPENFILSSYNLQPIGSGPFIFVDLAQTNTGLIKTIRLTSNRRYHNSPSFIENLYFNFFETKQELVEAANTRNVNGFSLAALDNNEASAEDEIKNGWAQQTKFSVYSLKMPRYVAVFFNGQKSSLFADPNIRKAFSYGVEKNALIKELYDQTKNNATVVDSPILPEFFGYSFPLYPYTFDQEKAKELLDKAGFKDLRSGRREKAIDKEHSFQFKSYLKIGSRGKEVTQLHECLARLDENFKNILRAEAGGRYTTITEHAVTEFQKKYLPDLKTTGETGPSTRQKLNELCFGDSKTSQPLAFTLTTINQSQYLKTAAILENYWESLGAEVEIRVLPITDLKSAIKERTYDALLYGQALGMEPDLYPFWHSSQKLDPGLNLSSYENKEADRLLKNARETLSQVEKQQSYESLQDIILADAPALFLYNPEYLYWASERIQGIETTQIADPAKRFSNVTNWYLKTKRVWK